MFYREVGQFKTSYDADEAILPIAQERWSVIVLIAFASLGVPLFAGQYLYTEVLIPVLILSIAAIGLNILTGYCGQLSLGSGGFMAVGAYAAYNLALRLPGTNIILVFLVAGVVVVVVGLVFCLAPLPITGPSASGPRLSWSRPSRYPRSISGLLARCGHSCGSARGSRWRSTSTARFRCCS